MTRTERYPVKASGRRSADETLAANLAAGRTIAESARAADVSESTIYRRLRCPTFAARVRELRGAMVASALGKLTEGMTSAASALTALVGNRNPDMRFRSAVKVIELALRVREQAEIEERLAAVERALRGEKDEIGIADREDRDGVGEDEVPGG